MGFKAFLAFYVPMIPGSFVLNFYPVNGSAVSALVVGRCTASVPLKLRLLCSYPRVPQFKAVLESRSINN